MKSIKEGYVNSKYYHMVVNWKRRRNMLLGVDVDGTWVKESRRGKEFFEERFKEMPLERPGLEGVELQKINEEDNNFFISNYEEYEVKQVV